MAHKSFPEQEEEVLRFWKENNIFQKSVRARERGKTFVFFEGPPTANGRPGIHHVLGRSFKDVIPRFKTMQGYWVWRRAGWDTHGLPVEIEVEKELGLTSKKQIEEYGIAAFNQKCRESVWRYKEEWERLTERMGFWIDLEDPYITYEPRYIENLWSILKRFWEKNLLFKDFKVVPYCVRCGTPISSHEVAQGYKTVKDRAVYVKFKVKGEEDTYVLAWTTTPWTLPGNVALAVGNDIEYVVAGAVNQESGIRENYILAKDRAEAVLGDREYEVVKEKKGRDLVGTEYEPLFAVPELRSEASYGVYAADFVTTDEGTGIVHTAVMYGVDDFELGTREELPKVHTVTEEGRFIKSVPAVGRLEVVTGTKKNAETEQRIIDYIKGKDLLFSEGEHEHEYPYCWRCNSPLLYYARESWFVGASQRRKDLLKNNKKINWVPAHIKEGRFGEWIGEAKDWAISRERYWGTPLPIWACTNEECGCTEVVGSLKELNEKRAGEPAAFVLMRHGEAVSNVEQFISSMPEKKKNPLTEKGRGQVRSAVRELTKEHIDVIYASDLERTKETALIAAEELGCTVHYDTRLREVETGTFNGTNIGEYHRFFDFMKTMEDEMETFADVEARTAAFLKEVASLNAGKTVLVVSHGAPLRAMENMLSGADDTTRSEWYKKNRMQNAGRARYVFPNWPLNERGEVDLHRPYVDEIILRCQKCGGTMRRTPELADVWFDSGAMPFAQSAASQAYSKGRAGGKKLGEPVKEQFPADFIAEGMDQTRGWFYTLHAVSTLLSKGPSYRNVISFDLMLDKEGKKMSKSVGNVVDPWQMIQTYGIDAVRWYFFTATSIGNSILFDEEAIKERERKFVMTVLNSLSFLETYWDDSGTGGKRFNALDRWVESSLNALVREVTDCLERFDIVRAARLVGSFVEDLSNWYIRRSRERLQSPDATPEKAAAQETLFGALRTLALLLAPLTPFLAEAVFQRLKKMRPGEEELESVHLADWPRANEKLIDAKLGESMELARSLASSALAERAAAGIKVRQKLGTLAVSPLDAEKIEGLEPVLAAEVNVARVAEDSKLSSGEVRIDTAVTPELERDGVFREMVRAVNALRKEQGMVPSDRVELRFYVTAPDGTEEAFAERTQELEKETRAADVVFTKEVLGRTVTDRGWEIKLEIKRV